MRKTGDMAQSIGQPVSRVEGVQKVTGAARYTADTPIEDPAYAVLVQAQIPHGRVTADSMATAAADAANAPGVIFVLTPLNCPALHMIPDDMTWDLPLERRPPLSDLTVQHVGQHLAMVVADSPENATHAASLMTFDYEQSPAQLSAQQVLAEPVVADEGPVRHGAYRPDHFVKLDEEELQDHRGPADEPAGVRVESTYRTPINTHYPIELSATIARWDGEDLVIHDSTRWITGERRALAAYLGITEERIRILSPLVGGRSGARVFSGCTWCSARWRRVRSAARSSSC